MRLRRRSFVLIVLGTLLVTVPLALTGYRAVSGTVATNKTTEVVQQWLQGTADKIQDVVVDGQRVTVTIEGAERPRSVDELAGQVEASLGYPVTVTLYIIPARVEVSQKQLSP